MRCCNRVHTNLKHSRRILFVTPELSSGGAERQMVNLALNLKNKGADVEFLVYTDDTDFYSDMLKKNEVKIIWLPLANYVKRVIFVRRFIRNGNYDAVISFLEVANFLNNFAAMGFTRKKWLTITGERNTKDVIFKGIRGHIFSWFMRYSDFIVCNTQRARQMWVEHYPKYTDKLKVIYNTVIIPNVSSVYVPKQNARLNVIVAATLYDIKNPVNLVKSLILMTSEERKKLHIDWYGKVPTLQNFDKQQAYREMMSLIKQYSLSDVIDVHDASKDIYNLMNQADVVALVSHFEGLPNVIAEGMMIGKPVVMSRVSDFDILVDQSNGFLCDSNNPESIKNALLKAAGLSVADLQRMGNMSKEKAENLFAMPIGVRLWRELLNL